MNRHAFAAAVILLPFTSVEAQQIVLRARVDAPPSRAAQPADTAGRYVTMPPGWHVNPGPGLILFDNALQGSGLYSIDAVAHFFPSPNSTEGIGLFFGGQQLTSEAPSYMMFLIRQDGHFQIARRGGNELQVLRAWTADTVVKKQAGDEPVANRLRVSVRPDSVLFIVNERRVAALPATGMTASGGFGLRIGTNANVHVSQLDFIRHLARPR